jgi:hypothetical protein
MKKVSFILIMSFLFSYASAQVEGGVNEKLAKIYLKGDFENCMFKAVDLTYNDKYKKDPEAYLYAAMSFYQLSLSEEPYIIEDYPKALKDAFKYLLKFKKKDKTKELTTQNEGEIDKIISAYFEEAVEFFKTEDYKKASYNFKQLANWYEYNSDIVFLQGMCDAMAGKTTANQQFDIAIPDFKSQKEKGNIKVRREVKEIFTDSFIRYSDYLLENEEADSAKATLNLGLELLPGNINIKSKIDSLRN